jgi:hypothetical protein
MNKWFVIGVLVLAAIFIACIARADYPLGFDKIKALCDNGTEVAEGVMGVEAELPDTLTTGNPDGKILLMAGEGPKGIGVAIAIVTSEGDPILWIGIIHFQEGDQNVAVNYLTGEDDVASDETVAKFLATWLNLYNKACGTKT